MTNQHDKDCHGKNVTDQSRRLFMARSALVAAAAAVAPAMMLGSSNVKAATLPAAVVTDVLNGVLAFVVPGNDPFSVKQGVTHSLPGGVEAYAVLPLEFGLNLAGSSPDPAFDTLSEFIAAMLIGTTGQLFPEVTGSTEAPYSSFSNLNFTQKTILFSALESSPAAPLVGALLTYAALMTYSEAPVLDPATGQLVASPVGWAISSYEGVSDGRKDFKGYYRGLRAALPW